MHSAHFARMKADASCSDFVHSGRRRNSHFGSRNASLTRSPLIGFAPNAFMYLLGRLSVNVRTRSFRETYVLNSVWSLAKSPKSVPKAAIPILSIASLPAQAWISTVKESSSFFGCLDRCVTSSVAFCQNNV